MRRLSLLSSACVLLAGCTNEPPSAPAALRADLQVASASSGTDSRAQWYFYRTLSDNATATRLYGDDRNLDGTPVANPGIDPSAYDGEARCGTRGTINWYRSSPRPTGNAFFAPRGGATALCQGVARSVTANLGSTILAGLGSTVTVPEVMQLAVGQSRTVSVLWVFNQSGCPRLMYELASGSGVTVTRMSGGTDRSPGEWTVESQGSHIAGCYTFGKGSTLTHTGPDYYLPFRARIVEVLR